MSESGSTVVDHCDQSGEQAYPGGVDLTGTGLVGQLETLRESWKAESSLVLSLKVGRSADDAEFEQLTGL